MQRNDGIASNNKPQNAAAQKRETQSRKWNVLTEARVDMPLNKLSSARLSLRRLNMPERAAHAILPVMFLLLATISLSVAAQPALSAPEGNLSPTEIVWRMVALNQTRAQRLEYFTSIRHYHIDFHGVAHSMAADMHVQVSYIAGSGKTFRIVDESGSGLLRSHVLRKLLEAERLGCEAQKAALTPFNYDFTFDRETDEGGRLLYVFSVEPKTKNRLLFRGRIWIDAADYAVVDVEAQPAENPSILIRSTEIRHTYEKYGEFWLPQSNRSESRMRSGGTAVLTIDYGTYRLEEPHKANSAEEARSALATNSTHEFRESVTERGSRVGVDSMVQANLRKP